MSERDELAPMRGELAELAGNAAERDDDDYRSGQRDPRRRLPKARGAGRTR
ncbi:hypothetical protein [Arthrobacter sp. ISL-72]|uniref:hypothetical protein n=1 Tax=Arthrobacter sp. ISL-72 TaxID=2819114 RepID=UPI001BECC721|nr:hypothetical protein [Arthrobacter sp. ISL-72]MBT2594749.1 hypothetical protein [Arthrobacter sp. ISL-72]